MNNPQHEVGFKKRLSFLFFITASVLLISCERKHTLFEKLSSSHTGISFNNRIEENDSINPLDLEFLYNGGGVAVGDFNNDGLADLYFTASTVSNKLYLNKGNMSFADVTDKAKVTGEGRWSNAASVVDINNDGLQDIYVCATIKKNAEERKSLLYINQGLSPEKIPVFKEMAAEYGLADTSYAVHAAFFDYDNDGDLDMYLVTTRLAQRDGARFGGNTGNTSTTDIDKLFRNDWNDTLKHPVYTDVSMQAGITHTGFGLGITVADINKDGWKDVYVTNDFFSSDVLYINNKNGTFTNKVNSCFKHTSQNAMGNDIADINNDGLADVLAVDMNPEDNYRKKKNMGGNNYYIYQNMLYEKISLQYVRNTLQLNMGARINENDSIGDPVFGDIAFYSGVAETDWSWNCSLADFDNDGNRDIIITNGYPRDVTDRDFAAFRGELGKIATKEQLIEKIPQIKIANYAYQNAGNLKFKNTTKQWGMDEPCFSTGAVYADLDNDGDLDYVINNINEEAFLYENTTNFKEKISSNYLTVQFKGDEKNLNGIGAWAEIYYDKGKMQVSENLPYRGYLSTVDAKAFFGLGNIQQIDSVIIRWPGNKKQILQNVKPNQLLTADIRNANITDVWNIPIIANAMFTDITASAGIDHTAYEMDFIDFNYERLLPHKLSQYGPGLAAGDVDGNGLDDIFIGGTGDFPGKFFMQQPDGKFIKQNLPFVKRNDARNPENLGLLLFDADADGDLDLYCANGSNEFAPNTKSYQDWLFANDGKGNFVQDTTALPINYSSKSCVKAADFDNDGDRDLFIGGRVIPGKYPHPVSSFIYRNDSKPGQLKFTDVTTELAKGLQNIGLTCDAVWTDFDNDGWIDLITVGEWMPIHFFKNKNGKFENISAASGINDEKGWWNSITAADFDNDGDIDYVAGNLGENSFYRASHEYPVKVYVKDFDKNGRDDAIPTVFLKDQSGNMKEYTAQNRDDVVEQLPALKKRFLTYKSFAEAEFKKIFTPQELKDAMVLHATNFKSSFIETLGNGKFKLHALPVMAQLAPLNGMVVDDFNHDGNMDIALCANDYGTEVTNGQYDALNGLVLTGDGKGNFNPHTILQSGLFVPGDAKALIKLKGINNTYLLAASHNKGPLKVFKHKNANQKLIPLQPTDRNIFITLSNGKKRKHEVYFGGSFLSQSSPFICMDSTMKKIEIVNNKAETRVVQ